MNRHYSVMPPNARGESKALCGIRNAQLIASGTLVQEDEITCPDCREKWQAGMRRVAKLMRTYQGEP